TIPDTKMYRVTLCALCPLIVLLFITRAPVLYMPPPAQALFTVMWTALSLKVPRLMMPPPATPPMVTPWLIVSLDNVTLALVLEIVTTVLTNPPSTTGLPPDPAIVKLRPMGRRSLQVVTAHRAESLAG